MKKTYLLLLAVLGGLGSCSEEPIGQTPVNNIPPATVTNVSVENFNGGAKISYHLPEDEDLMYVEARYEVNGVKYQTSASLYKNFVEVQGFGNTSERQVELVCVDKSMNESEPVSVTIHPLTPPIDLIFESLRLQSDFGGIRASWKNEHKADISVTILLPDSFGILKPYPGGTFYSDAVNGTGVIRGFPSEKQFFAVTARDRWGNQSDTVKGDFVPLYEEKLDKSKFRDLFLEGDKPLNKYGWSIRNLWNDKINVNEGAHGDGVLGVPYPFTFDLGQTAQLSRIVVNHRPSGQFSWGNGGGFNYEIWGTDEYIDDGDYSEWTLLLDCLPEKPSGLPYGDYNDEDAQLWIKGFEYDVPIDAPKVRYLRFVFKDAHPVLAEITVYGEPEGYMSGN